MFNARPAGSESVDQDGRSLSIPRRGRGEGAAGASGVSIGAGLLTRVVQLVLSVVVAIIVAGILLVVLKANPGNSIVSEVHSWARWLTGPFDGMFSLSSASDAIAVNWGIAAIVYLFAGVLITRLFARAYR